MTDPNGLSPEAAGGIGALVLALLYAAGRGIAWLLGWSERRQQARAERLDAEQAAVDEGWSAYRKRIETRLAHLEDQSERCAGENALLRQQVAALRTAFELVAAPLRVSDPDNANLRMADQILTSVFPLDPSTPPEMGRLLGKIK